MIRKKHLVAGAAALALSAALTACNYSKDLVNPHPPVDARFASYVALGNSITAGYQSSGINDSTQQQAYPVLLAEQMKTPFTIPALAKPGCPPPVDNFLTQTRVSTPPPIVTEPQPCSFRKGVHGDAVINNVAVPGSFVSDLTDPKAEAANGTSSNPLITFILGGKTQVQRALQANPTFASVWIGNNDVLVAALSGVLVPMAGVSPGITPQAQFEESFNAILNGLTSSPSLKAGVLVGVVDVTNAPILFRGAALNDPQVKGAIEAVAGKPITVDASCTPTTKALINFQLIGQIRAGAMPATIACAPLGPPPNPVGQVYVLDETEVAQVSSAVTAYNAYIKAQADRLGWAYLDPNPALLQLRSANAIPAFPNLQAPTKPFGDYISLDGVHPAGPAHRLITDLLIDAINAKYGTSIPKLQ
jgi:lysophospholipase L1-like esterase